MAAHQAPPSLGFSRQEHWSELPFPSPMHESEKGKWSRSVVSDSTDPMDCSLPGSSIHGIFQARVLEWGTTALLATVFGLPQCVSGKGSAGQCRRRSLDPWVGKIPWRRKGQPTPIFLPAKFLGQRSLAGYSPWGPKESDTTKQLNNNSLHCVGLQILSLFQLPVEFEYTLDLRT